MRSTLNLKGITREHKKNIFLLVPSLYSLILLTLLPLTLSAQEFKYSVREGVVLEAKSAKVYPQAEGVLLYAVELNPEQKLAYELTLEGLTEPQVEVTQLLEFQGITVGVYPSKFLDPIEGNLFLIVGKPGERYGVRARTATGIKDVIIEIKGDIPDPVDPPPTDNLTEADLLSVTQLTQQSIVSLADPISTRYVQTALSQLSLSEVLGEAASQMKQAISKALLDSIAEVRPPYKDWERKFRKPLDAKIADLVSKGKVTNGTQLSKVIQAVVKGMTPSTSVLDKSGTVQMFTRTDCTLCIQWKNEVWPKLQKVGWKLEELDGTGSVPSFVICENGKCSNVIVGYMTVERFNQERRLSGVTN